jgi:hypothetical protein
MKRTQLTHEPVDHNHHDESHRRSDFHRESDAYIKSEKKKNTSISHTHDHGREKKSLFLRNGNHQVTENDDAQKNHCGRNK